MLVSSRVSSGAEFAQIEAELDPFSVELPELFCSFEFPIGGNPPRENPDPMIYVHFGDGKASNTVRLVHKVSSLNLEESVDGMEGPIQKASVRVAVLLAMKDEHRSILGTRSESFVDSAAGSIEQSTTGIWDELIQDIRGRLYSAYAGELPNIRKALASLLRENYVSLFRNVTASALGHGASKEDLLRALDETLVATVLKE